MPIAPTSSPELPLAFGDLASCGCQQAIARDLVEQQCAAMARPADTVDTAAIDHTSKEDE
ncbi:hypothetical protein [Janthinobacterium sp. MDT1-19]|uniref:hypothetical protein n=1 Tax=Janthinobacterium sp. MDT1-19 TaxID=1259339 RepID=UPI003F27A9DB